MRLAAAMPRKSVFVSSVADPVVARGSSGAISGEHDRADADDAIGRDERPSRRPPEQPERPHGEDERRGSTNVKMIE